MNRYMILSWMALTWGAPAWSQFAPVERVIVAIGRAEVPVVPDIVDVQLGVEHQAPTAREAMEQTSRATQAVVDRLRHEGVPDRRLRTAALRLESVYEGGAGTNQPLRLVGYRATNTLIVTVKDVTRAGPIVDAGLEAGANQMQGIEFRVANDLPLRLKALKAAVAEAHTKARVIATSMNITLRRVASVTEYYYDTRGGGFGGGGVAGGMRVPVQSGEITIGAQVSVRYHIGDR